MSWFTFKPSQPLSLSANSLLRSLYASNAGQAVDKIDFLTQVDFTPDEFSPAFKELKNKGYVVELMGQIGVTASGRQRCENAGMRLRTPGLRHPGGIA